LTMSLYYNSNLKIKNICRTIEVLLDSDFPHGSGRKALIKLNEVFSQLGLKLSRAHRLNDNDTVQQISNNITIKIYQVLPILGFILRSTNVRNAFELVDPLQTIADATLQGRPELLLSSEWDYVPFAYPQSLDDLKSFVLIGLPATEASSALLIPLAGHELGHAVWANRGIGGAAHVSIQQVCEELYSKKPEDFKRHFPEYDPKDIIKSSCQRQYHNLLSTACFKPRNYFATCLPMRYLEKHMFMHSHTFSHPEPGPFGDPSIHPMLLASLLSGTSQRLRA